MVRRPGSGLIFTLIAFGVASVSRPTHGQTISFLHPLSGSAFGTLSNGVFASTSALAADASGVYVVGAKGLAKYDSRGNELWTRAFGAFEQIWGPAADGAGVYVAGRIFNPPNPQVLFLRRYDAGGNALWTLQTDLFPFPTAADASGLYMAGAVSGQTITTLIVRKYDASGAEQWTRPFGTPKLGVGINGMAAAATGLYVVGGDDSSTSMRKYDASGNERWSRQVPRFSFALTADETGVYLVTGGPDDFLRKYDASGNELWGRPVGATVRAVAADATGIYVAGGGSGLPGQCRSGVNGDAFARKYDPDGTELWTRESFSAAYSASSVAAGVAVDDTRDLRDWAGKF